MEYSIAQRQFFLSAAFGTPSMKTCSAHHYLDSPYLRLLQAPALLKTVLSDFQPLPFPRILIICVTIQARAPRHRITVRPLELSNLQLVSRLGFEGFKSRDCFPEIK
jgi:hypothetical protein